MSTKRTQSKKAPKKPNSAFSVVDGGVSPGEQHAVSREIEDAATMAISPVELSTTPLQFSPVNAITSVFFDETNKQVFVVQEGSPMLVVCSMRQEKNEKIRLSRGPVISVKYSLDYRILAIQRTSRTVVFVNHGKGLDPAEYSQSCKSKSSSQLLGFVWTSATHLVFITNVGLEFYQVSPEKRHLKLLKSYSLSVNWFVYSHEQKVLLLSSSLQANILQPYLFKESSIVRYAKFEADLPVVYNQLSQKLLERDVYLAPIYGRLYCMIVKNNPKSASGQRAEITLLRLTREQATTKAILVLNMNGRFAINTVNNLILVHHQASKTTMVYDLKWGTVKRDGTYLEGNPIEVLRPIVSPFSIAPAKSTRKPVSKTAEATGLVDDVVVEYEAYSASWIVFQPDIVIDAKLGLLWNLDLTLESFVKKIPDKNKVLDFLLRRQDAKETILNLLLAAIVPETQSDLGTISRMFDQINYVYAQSVSLGSQTTGLISPSVRGGAVGDVSSFRGASGNPNGTSLSSPNPARHAVIINQNDMYTSVFLLLEDTPIKYQFMVAVLIEYIRSLSQLNVPVEHFLYELVINQLVRHNRYYQLHQFLQYHVVNDSKHVACLLLSLESTYPPAFQLALDMLKRLLTANEEIVDVLVSKNQLLLALRFLRNLGPEAVATVPPRRFLEAAYNTHDASLFYIVYKFFEQRNITLRKRPEFRKGEDVERYVAHFNKMFLSNHGVV
eukprot:m.299467 g.299467  ORF g.299467 m.299467 type:complete len:725 (+) comp20113_c0_seq2:179-2353(+)